MFLSTWFRFNEIDPISFDDFIDELAIYFITYTVIPTYLQYLIDMENRISIFSCHNSVNKCISICFSMWWIHLEWKRKTKWNEERMMREHLYELIQWKKYNEWNEWMKERKRIKDLKQKIVEMQTDKYTHTHFAEQIEKKASSIRYKTIYELSMTHFNKNKRCFRIKFKRNLYGMTWNSIWTWQLAIFTD